MDRVTVGATVVQQVVVVRQQSTLVVQTEFGAVAVAALDLFCPAQVATVVIAVVLIGQRAVRVAMVDREEMQVVQELALMAAKMAQAAVAAGARRVEIAQEVQVGQVVRP